ncbi:MAG TPA: 3-phosphoshikimate 1-carboxyvinyltransferase [Bacteroidia bacterium]
MFLSKINRPLTGKITLPASKSISNRYLMICALSNHQPPLMGLSDSSDTRVLESALYHPESTIDFKDAGTPLRFYLAYAALKGCDFTIDGSERLRERPIGDLLQALKSIGASFEFFKKDNQLPLKVVNKVDLSTLEVTIDGSLSSQFVSALLLIAPFFKNGLTINILGEQVSKPYVEMTLDMMRQAGIKVNELPDKYQVSNGQYSLPDNIEAEADWSAATFVYAFAALLPNTNLFLPGLTINSSQGDSKIAEIFESFGVKTTPELDGIRIQSSMLTKPKMLKLDFAAIPDAFPAICALCAATRTEAEFTGIKNLVLKESNRVEAMKNNLAQTACKIEYLNDDTVQLSFTERILKNYTFDSYGDHRIAMACSIFATLTDIEIINEEVVSKSFPNYWAVLKQSINY